MLSIYDHRRDSAGLKYVYPVISRRAGGVSVGINLNTNNACNWACIYCQVENLSRGGPPPVDLPRLGRELRSFLADVLQGNFMARHVPEDARRLVDLAFSGNGEPTSAIEFPAAITLVGEVMAEFGLQGHVPLRVITNGSLVYRPGVQGALENIAGLGGEVWFKVDRGDAAGMVEINETAMDPLRVRENLALCVARVPTWVQTCWFSLDGVAPSVAVLEAYCALLAPLAEQLQGIHLYGLARPSLQSAAPRLGRLSVAEMEDVAANIQKKTGIRVLLAP